MRVLSLFDGISCGMVALERAGFEVSDYAAFEIDKYALQVSCRNYPQIRQFGDVFKGDYKAFKDYDLLLGGSPCTHWSIAKHGRETTPEGIGWQLFMEYKRALTESGCRYFLFENNYSIHKDIKAAISQELGVQPMMINSALVSAQQRKRCYWTNIQGVEQPKDRGILLKDIIEAGITERDKSHCLTTHMGNARDYFKKGHTQIVFHPVRLGHYGKGGQGQRIYSIYGKSVTIAANGGGQGGKTGLYRIDLPDGDYIIRSLTPVETERLQTLPNGYTDGISNTQRYRCLGNGWTVDVIAHILSFIQNERKE